MRQLYSTGEYLESVTQVRHPRSQGSQQGLQSASSTETYHNLTTSHRSAGSF